jgi:hypothetical protein
MPDTFLSGKCRAIYMLNEKIQYTRRMIALSGLTPKTSPRIGTVTVERESNRLARYEAGPETHSLRQPERRSQVWMRLSLVS